MVDAYVKRKTLHHCARGLNPSAVSRALADEGLAYSRKSVATLLRKFRGAVQPLENRALGDQLNMLSG